MSQIALLKPSLPFQNNLLLSPSDYRFIADRKLLAPFETLHCNEDSVVLSGNMMGGKPVLIKLLFADFNPKEHRIVYNSKVADMIESIDEKPVHGTHFESPKRAISGIKFCIGDDEFDAPEAAFQNIYEFYLCEGSGFNRPIQAFTSMNQEYVYLYFVGGNASDTYFGKLAFNQEEYVTRIITGYGPLHLHAAFHDGFIGF